MKFEFTRLSLALAWLAACPSNIAQPVSSVSPDRQPGLVKSEFIFETAPFASSHASTIVETKEGLLAAWFGGPHERHPEVVIWTARHAGESWSAPVRAADGKWVKATGHVSGEAVVVSNPAVKQPTAVRYAWADNPDCNLYNGAGLPASPFRLGEEK